MKKLLIILVAVNALLTAVMTACYYSYTVLINPITVLFALVVISFVIAFCYNKKLCNF